MPTTTVGTYAAPAEEPQTNAKNAYVCATLLDEAGL
ncbi:hypothetical protein SBA2_20006 [Acidobacteriia bacterium SbA2]|nr:hypothetical protein SBA2_20006 [Acidobacteriia bacterium SbA2]